MSYPNTPTRLHRYFVTILLVLGVLLTGLLISCGSNSGEDDPSSSAADAASGCNDTDSHADSDADTSSGEHEHEYTEKTVQPTCTESGYVLFSCSCGDSYKENETEPLGHTYGEWIVVTEATAEADGLRERSCSLCGEKDSQSIPKLAEGHVHSYVTAVTAPTCAENGYTTYTCSCGDSYKADEVRTTGHAYGNWITVKEATASSEGKRERTCSRCGEKLTQTTPKLSASHRHTYTEYTVKPTCTMSGYTTYTCSCGDSYQANEASPLGHSFGEWKTVKEATASSEGKRERTCSRCGEKQTQTTPKSSAAHVHSYAGRTVQPSCRTGGYTLYTCACGDSYRGNETAALGHKYGTWQTVKEPTENAEGSEERLCSRCSDRQTQSIPKLSHTHKYSGSTVQATCEAGGYTLYTCACGSSYRGNETAALGHSYGEWKIHKTATAVESGVKQRKCSRCGAKEQQSYSLQNPQVPTMYITTSTGSPVTSKSYVTGTVKVTGSGDWDFSAVNMKIRGRGNSSWNGGASQSSYDSKNSYRLRLDEKQNLLGVGGGKNRDWVLNSNKFDVSNLRNYIIWQLAAKMGNIPFVPNCTWVHLYINSQYRGLYMVTDHVEIANDRVEIQEGGTGDSLGFLVELDMRGDKDEGVVEDLDYFYIENYPHNSGSRHVEWVIKDKDVKNSTARTAEIKAYIKQCHNAIVGGNRETISKLIDIPSFVDMFILEELAKDVDMNQCSIYFQKDAGGKLCMTAPWDFDFGFGTYGDAVDVNNLICSRDNGNGNYWFRCLLKTDWFRTEVINRMNSLVSDGTFRTVISNVQKMGSFLTSAADKNNQQWNVYGNHYHSYVSWQVSANLKSYAEHINYLVNFASQRWDIILRCVRNY